MHNYFFYNELYKLNELFFYNGFNGLNGFSLMHNYAAIIRIILLVASLCKSASR